MGLRVQLVEDEPNIVVTLTYLLERAGFDVSTTTDGETALNAALAAPPDVMILEDRWTAVTCDGSLSAHFEHTVAITEDGPRILTL